MIFKSIAIVWLGVTLIYAVPAFSEELINRDENYGKAFWAKDGAFGFYAYPACDKEKKISYPTWFWIQEIAQNGRFEGDRVIKYKVILENKDNACFQYLHGYNIANQIDIFQDDMYRNARYYLDYYGITPNKAVWTKYPTGGLPAFVRVDIKALNISIVAVDVYTITIFGKIANNDISITLNGVVPKLADDYFYVNDPASVYSKWSKKVIDLVKNQKIALGLTKEQTLAAWGKPEKINETVGSYGKHEQWVYKEQYVYFENGKLTTWQSSQ